MDAAHDAGINFFDTANVLRRLEHRGGPRRSSAAGSPSGGGRRERTVLATKLYGDMTDRPNEGKLSALNIRRALDASLKRLQTDYIDLYQFHHVDRDTPWDEIWQAIEVAVQQGKILYAGSSNFAGWHIAAGPGRRSPAQLHRPGQRAVASTTCWPATSSSRCIPAAQQYGLGIIPWSPLHGGLLGGVLRKETRGRPAARGPGSRRPRKRIATRSSSTRTSPTTRSRARRCRPGLAAAPAGGDRTDHRPAHPWSSSTPHCARWRSSSTTKALDPAGRDLPRSQDRTRGLRLVTRTTGNAHRALPVLDQGAKS